jgi:hypothetical protein
VQVRRQRRDHADIEIPVGPAVETASNARCERVVDRRVAQGAGDAHGAQRPSAVEQALHAADRVEFEQGQRSDRVVEIHRPFLDLVNQPALRIAGGKGSWPSARFSLALEDRVTEERSDDDVSGSCWT